MRFCSLIALYFLGSFALFSQTDVMKTIYVEEGYALPTPKIKYQKPTLHIGAGAIFYTGTMREKKQFDKYIRPGMGFQVGLEQRFSHFGIESNLIYGQAISTVQTQSIFQNFKTQLINGDLRLGFHLDQIMSKKISVAPFFKVGAGWLNISSQSNRYSLHGKAYHPWSDGTLRSLPEQAGNEHADILENDHSYDTDETPNKRNMAQIIGEIGLKFKILNFWDIQTSYSHFYSLGSFTSYSGKNDHYGFARMSLVYYFGQINFKKKGGIIHTQPNE